MKLNNKYLLTPIFLISLILLLCNDFYFKYAFHNELTGKLSDFSGIIVLVLFLHFLNDQHRIFNTILVAIFFVYWKSSMSDQLISFWNDLGLYHVSRVVDYWDLTALVTLPLLNSINFKERTLLMRKTVTSSLVVLTVFALCSTSRHRTAFGWNYNSHVIYEFSTKLKLHEFVENLENHERMKYVRQDSLIVNNERVNSYLFVSDTSQYYFLDSCRFTYVKKNNRKLNIQLISAGIGSIENLMDLDLPSHIESFKLSSKVTSSRVNVTWIK